MRRLLCFVLVLSCSGKSEDLLLPESTGMLTLMLTEEIAQDSELEGYWVVDLSTNEGREEALALLNRSDRNRQSHLTALQFASTPSALGFLAGRGSFSETGLPIPAFDLAYRIRLEPDYHTPWRLLAELPPRLAAARLPAECIDEDDDGYGEFCELGPDCDDSDRERSPGETERCNQKDDNCNNEIDEGFEIGTCWLPEGSCWWRGEQQCGTDCTRIDHEELICCKSGTPDEGACCLGAPATICDYECIIDPVSGFFNCSGPVQVNQRDPGELTATLDLSGHSALELNVVLCEPTGWVLHLGDSPGNNGGGGDVGERSNDAELHVVGSTLSIYGNDYIETNDKELLIDGDFVPTTSTCTSRVFRVRDQWVSTSDPCHEVSSPYALRLNPEVDDEAPPDAIWYLGVNRTYALSSRSGTGTKIIRICLLK